MYGEWLPKIGVALACYACTSAIALLGVCCATVLFPGAERVTFLDAVARADGGHFATIVDEGYSYSEQEQSNVAFFPLYPLIARGVASATGWPARAALLVVAHLSLSACFVLLAAYYRGREAAADQPSETLLSAACSPNSGQAKRAALLGLVAFALLPPTFFFRMDYSEATFLLLVVLTMYGLQQRWPLLVCAAIAGLATAARHVGVALVLPLAWHAFRRSSSPWRAVGKLALLLPLACWGLVAYMAFQQAEFHDALAFVKTQHHWRMRPPAPFGEKLLSLLAWEPIWSVYDPNSVAYWGRFQLTDWGPLVSLQFANPIYFLAAAGLVALGAAKRWLTTPETLLAAAILAIPYLARSYEMGMNSQARFAAVAFPAYIVAGKLLARLPLAVSGGLLALCGILMGIYAAAFAAGLPFL